MRVMTAKTQVRFAWALIAMALAAQPAMANTKDRTKRDAASCTDCCKPVVRSMSETTPTRKSECPKARRILM
jgi:hypothetical protein